MNYWVHIEKLNNINARVSTNYPSVISDLVQFLSVYKEGYRFAPKYKMGIWDGKIYFMSKAGVFPIGLLKYVYDYTKNFPDLNVTIDKTLLERETIEDFEEVTDSWLGEMEDGIPWVPRPHQIGGAKKALKYKRGILEHATGSGKSLTMALIIMYRLLTSKSKKVLVLVPNTGLIQQLSSDFINYGIPTDYIGKFYADQKDFDNKIIISTWQSMCKQEHFIRDFDLFLSDECLHPDTNITMSDGTTKKIKDVQIGEYVKTINEQTKEIESKKIVKVHHNLSIHEKMYRITFENGTFIDITGNHKLYTKNRGWVRADELTEDDDIEEIRES